MQNRHSKHIQLNQNIMTTKASRPKKVLIVEDEGDMCLLLNIILAGKELECDHVKSLAAAKAYLQQEQPAVVLLDNKLPDGFGVDFIPFVKSNYPTVRIIMISGFDGSVKDVALENGADVFLAKPFTKSQLHDAVMQVLHAGQPAPAM